MKIYETAVRKPISTILIFVGVIVFGLFSLNNLAVDQYPDIEIPQIAVITSYAGANAADIETNITRVLEDNLNTVENLKKMTSKSSDNFSMITLEFEYGSDLTEAAKDIRDAGVHLSFVPEDRLGMGLVGTMGMTDNMMLKSYGEGRSPLVDHRAPRELAEKIRKELGVVTPGLNTPVSRLSGGNVQKVLVGRELAASPIVLMTAYAVRGLDINTSYTIYNLLNEQKEKGVAVIYVGEDLDVLLELCDRILVLCGGKANGMLDARTTTKEEVGLRMTNLVQKEGK